MQFETDDGHTFYYRGKSQNLLLLTQDEYSPHITFTAAFEPGYLDHNAPPVALAKRPTKISVNKLNVRKCGLPLLRGDNHKFAKERVGLAVHKYFNTFDSDCNTYLKSLTGESFLGTGFNKLLRYAANTKVYSFLAFGLYIRIDNEPVRLEIQIEDPEIKIDTPDLIKHLKSMDVDFLKCGQDGANFCSAWATTKVYIECRVNNRRINLKLARRINVLEDTRSVKEVYKHFEHKHGMASDADWLDLFQRSEKEAKAGSTDAMYVLAFLLDTSIRCWERQPEEAKKWRDKAGEAGDSKALLIAGLRLGNQRNPTPEDVNEAMGYYQRAAAMGEDRAWDEISYLLDRYPEMIESITLDSPIDLEFDRSAWLRNDKEWLRERRASWNTLEPLLKSQYKVKDLAKLKKYYLNGELPVSDYGDQQPPIFNLSLFDVLWLHPSEDYDELMALRHKVFAHPQFGRRKFHEWQDVFHRRLVMQPMTFQAGHVFYGSSLHILNTAMYFRIINNNYTQHGYHRHGEFIKLRPPADPLRDWMDLAVWFWLPELKEANLAFTLLDPDALEWWYSLMPNNIDFFKRLNADKLPYIFLTFYRMSRFDEREIDCPVRKEFNTRLQGLLNKKPFCEKIDRLWVYVRDTDFTLKDAWVDMYGSVDEWKLHKNKY
ncbi:tetratricopeptide repeat protein [Microbulbifer sp. ANSA005]